MINASGFKRRARSTVSPWVKVNSSRLATKAPEPRSTLESEEAHDVGPRERLVEVVDHRDRPGRHVVGQQRARGTESYLGAEGGVGRDVAARDPTVADVADDQDLADRRNISAAGLESGRAAGVR